MREQVSENRVAGQESNVKTFNDSFTEFIGDKGYR